MLGAPLAATLGVPLDRAGRVIVEPNCSLPGHPDAFVVGDLATFSHMRSARPVPGVALAATQMGAFVAKAILANGPRGAIVCWVKGSMATIGRARAIVVVGRLRFAGVVAWLAWVAVHILFLIIFRNRLLVMSKWARA